MAVKEITAPSATVEQNGSELRIQVDLDNFELEDLEILDLSRVEKLPGGQVRPVTPMRIIIDLLDRVVVGGVRGKGYKAAQFWQIFNAVSEAVGSNLNP